MNAAVPIEKTSLLGDSAAPSFEQFSLSPAMRAALRAADYRVPTPIQEATIAPALAGRDVIGAAQTGTGKTAAFMIPLVERLHAAQGSEARAMAVILAPTRELAEQIFGWAKRLGCGLRSALVVGGVAYGPQLSALRSRPSIIVATPGRLVDHLDRGTLTMKDVRFFVLDEADRMLDMGFKPQLDRIMGGLPARRQTLLFSATMPANLGALARMHLHEPVRAAVGQQALPPSRATQDVYLVDSGNKTPLLLSMIAANAGNVLVFARTKHRTDRVTRSLCDAGHAAQRLHSNRSQSQRREALEGFRRGRYRILVATDIAARGIDVAGIGHVINYDLPQTVEDYVHRVGRTARAEAEGHASSFAAPEERAQLHAIERHIGRALPRQTHGSHGATPRAAGPGPRHAAGAPRGGGAAAGDRHTPRNHPGARKPRPFHQSGRSRRERHG